MLPYLASSEWYMASAAGDSPRLPSAEDSLRLPSRELTRTLVASPSGGDILLTVPVAGGASSLKRLNPEQLEISMHGNWPRIHLGALDAAYGRTPFFRHIQPEIGQRIAEPGHSLALLSSDLDGVIRRFLDFERQFPPLLREAGAHPERFRKIRESILPEINLRHSFLEAVARLGRDALFLLLPLDNPLVSQSSSPQSSLPLNSIKKYEDQQV